MIVWGITLLVNMVKQEYFPILVGIFIQVYMENSLIMFRLVFAFLIYKALTYLYLSKLSK